ncbi:FecR domain-containing protein [Bythopirellula polymerisocia]|uniref:FecR protein n=1 Tax=Bythopirellula polymerisocia TaxID=2528003 RepID=A0A5C6CXP3_9BACT|nr:FecR domain-containing protein [Bythopirellula polymerisocia]TWU28665.1 FecR protein [Bythopirellula polymerisocia]
MTDRDIDKLIAAWLDGHLDADDSQALQKELQGSAEAREKFRKYSHLDVALHEYADTSGMLGHGQLIANLTEQLPSRTQGSQFTTFENARGGQPQVTLHPTRFDTKGMSAFRRVLSWYTALAVGVLLAVSLVSFFNYGERRAGHSAQLRSAKDLEAAEEASVANLRKPPAPVATLASEVRSLWENSQLEVGQAFYEGETVSLQQGKARISVGFGAEIVAEAPFSLTFVARDQVNLHQGNVAVHVAPWAKGFTVVTEEMDIVDLGTTFTVSAFPGVKTKTTVLKGVVRASSTRNSQPRGLLISEGQQVSIDGEGLFESVQQQDVKHLLASLDFGDSGAYRPVALNNTGIGLEVGDEDLHWRVVAGPEGSFSGKQFATVCTPERGYLPNSPNTSQWLSISDWQTASPNSIYTFQTEFDLEGYDLSTMQLFGRFLADNGIAAVRVNGNPVEVKSWVDNVKYQPFGDQQFRFVNITKGLVKGQNIIEVDVQNGMMRSGIGKNPPIKAIPNPMALRVEWYAFGRQQTFAEAAGNAKLFHEFQNDYSSRLTLSGGLPSM